MRRSLLIVTGVLSLIVLLATAATQIVDTNFYTLWEATNLLAGDHPYRDFVEWGVPLQAYASALAQRTFGYRLLSEFILQWSFIIAGLVIACDLASRLCASRAVVLASIVPAILLLAVTPAYHYPKLFFYPVAVWLLWRYLDEPRPRHAAALGIVTALAFLFRHDHGVYIGVGAAIAFSVERFVRRRSHNVRMLLVDAGAYLTATLIALSPWIVAVHRAEGINDYIRSRADLYRDWSASTFPVRAVASINPVRELLLRPRPLPQRGVLGFVWSSEVPDAERRLLEAKYRLRDLGKRDAEGRYLYEVPNVFDPALIELNPSIRNETGFQFDAIRAMRSPFPTLASAQLWLMQMAFVVPAILLVSRLLHLFRLPVGAEPKPDTYHVIVASILVLVAESRLFREASYVVTMTPLVAAFAAPLMCPPDTDTRRKRLVRLALAIPLFTLTMYAVVGWTRGSDLFHPADLPETVRLTLRRMAISPPIDALEPREHAVHVTRAEWDVSTGSRAALLMRYMFDCAAADDRILVTGITPFHIGYYVDRPIAGGHVFWHHRWRSDPVHEQQSLALLQRQSVPFVFSTDDPVLDDFKAYPSILSYLRSNYVELQGSSGRMLIDRRRAPTRTFGELAFPCFR